MEMVLHALIAGINLKEVKPANASGSSGHSPAHNKIKAGPFPVINLLISLQALALKRNMYVG